MFWAMAAVAGGFLGLAVLGVLAVRVYLAAARLGREVSDAARRISHAAEELEEAAQGAARASAGVVR